MEPSALKQPPRLQSGTHQQREPRHRLGLDSAKQPLPSCGLGGRGHAATTGAEETDLFGEAPDCGILEGRGPALGDGQTRDICFLNSFLLWQRRVLVTAHRLFLVARGIF